MWRKICKERAILNFFFIVLFFQGYKMHTFSLHCLHFPRLLLQKTNYLPISVNQWQKNPLWICISEMNFVLKESPNLCLLYCHFHISKMEKVLPEKDIINFRFLTTETNIKASYIFCCLFTTSSVLLCSECTDFCWQMCFSEKGKTILIKPFTFWKWKHN